MAGRGSLALARRGPLSLLTSPLLSATAKLRVFAEPFVARDAVSGEASVADFFGARFGRGIVEPLLDAVVTGICAGSAERIEARGLFPRAVELVVKHGS